MSFHLEALQRCKVFYEVLYHVYWNLKTLQDEGENKEDDPSFPSSSPMVTSCDHPSTTQADAIILQQITRQMNDTAGSLKMNAQVSALIIFSYISSVFQVHSPHISYDHICRLSQTILAWWWDACLPLLKKSREGRCQTSPLKCANHFHIGFEVFSFHFVRITPQLCFLSWNDICS